METDLLASLGSKGKNGNSLACLRNAGSHSAMTYCIISARFRRLITTPDPCLLCLDLRLGLLFKHMRTTALGLGCMNEHVLALLMV